MRPDSCLTNPLTRMVLTLLARDCWRGRIAVARAHNQVWISHPNFDHALRIDAGVFISIVTEAVLHAEFGRDRFKSRPYGSQIVGLVKPPARLIRQSTQVRLAESVTTQ